MVCMWQTSANTGAVQYLECGKEAICGVMMKIVEDAWFDVCVCARLALIRRRIVHLILNILYI